MKTSLAEEFFGGGAANTAAYDAPRDSSTSMTAEMTIVIIDPRMLMRECLTDSLNGMATGATIVAFASVEQWQKAAASYPSVSLVLLCIGARRANASEVARSMTLLAQINPSIPIILVGDIEDQQQIIEALESGARGYIPTSASLSVTLGALRLVWVGGTYIPAASIISRRGSMNRSSDSTVSPDMFTRQQRAVLRALREGKANKLIAYELNVTEATIKVHMRGIMKKLRARNRTEVVCMVNDMFSGENRI